ncbi:UDP-3-O-(3-hydroxymyristoyl)glucosamine N-acyltransferase [Niveibacterium microcysteis]|uniref:UDP-3-O-acylglucosamine N-acyltransferase n=1 Tax=Niveibacterium microcysteis TaxID=2811415 RepID=A0ABX7M3W3_9RHOO|nr:UDP-3-O-(3-hydroxymyristoyl)glucosamine N-acyltransferase [Niveibacterium microcysteis]QSI75130.1 UDP-3-O-(3-hydroxymyristoyl)glucosamine N-acyltransferase [Niveibacterium microcysteis]
MPTLVEIVGRLGGRVVGDGATVVSQVGSLESAQAGEIAFLASAKYRKALATTGASAVVLPPAAESASELPRIIVDQPYLYFARLAQLLNPTLKPEAGIHPSAVVESVIPPSVSVGPLAYVGPRCEIGEHVVIGPGCVVEAGSKIGDHSLLYGNVSLYHETVIGQRCIIHSGAVIGGDGFGYARERSGAWVKIPQIGRAVLGDDVEVGANTTIDRGALDDTVIGNGVKLDNMVQIAHNVKLGEHTAMAGCSGVAGSTVVGARVMVGGQAGINGHIEVASDTVVSSRTLISKTVKEPGIYTSAMPAMPHDEWMKSAAHFRHLDALVTRLRELEKRIAELERKP